MRIPDGEVRYSIPLAIANNAPIEVMLDTGSVGLRVLDPTTIQQGAPPSASMKYQYGFSSGVLFNGERVDTHVTLGGVTSQLPMQRVTSIACMATRPRCPATAMSSADFRIGAAGAPRVGYQAILGIGPARADGRGLRNPLAAMGFQSWTLELPLPGSTEPGRLTLYRQPVTPDGFIAVSGDERGRVPGCIRDAEGASLCGAMLFDTGVVGILIRSPDIDAPRIWPAGMPTVLRLTDGSGLQIAFPTGARGSPMLVGMQPSRQDAQPVIYCGVLPYFYLVVRYGGDGRVAGLRLR